MASWVSKVVAAIATRLGTIVAVVVIVALTVQITWCRARNASDSARKAELALLELQVDKLVAELGGVKGEMKNAREIELTPEQIKFFKSLRGVDKKAGVESVSHTGVTIKDTAPGVVTKDYVEDVYHRFHFDLPSGLLHREQKFTLSLLTIRGVDGAYRVQKADFKEFDPKTGEEIPLTNVAYSGTYEFVEEHAEGAGPWHLRAVAAVAYPWGLGAGIEVNPYKHLTLAGLLLYQPDEKAVVGAVGAGWRLFNSNVAVGPYLGISSKGGIVSGGAMATIEVTR